MLVTVTALAVIVLTDPPKGKEPPTKEELAAITVGVVTSLATMPLPGTPLTPSRRSSRRKAASSGTSPTRLTRKWVVAFGRLDEKQGKFLITYEATQGDKPDVFDLKEMTPPKEDTGFCLSAARAIDTCLKDFVEHFEGEQRPYNVAVLPAEKGRLWVYLVPAPTKPKVWPLGGDVRYLVSENGIKIVQKRQLHKAVIENEPPKQEGNQQMAGIHTHVLSDSPEDTDVFHVLTRKPNVPEFISTEHFMFVVEVDGSIKFQGNAEGV